MEIKWKTIKGSHSGLHSAWVGGIKVGTTWYNGIDRGDETRYIGNSLLPQADDLKKFPTEAEAMAHVESLVRQWLDKLMTNVQ